MTKPDYLPESFVVGISLLGAACLTLATLILAGLIPYKEAVEHLGSVTAATIGVIGAILAGYLAHHFKTKHDRRSIAKALCGEVTAIRTWLFNACDNPPHWDTSCQHPLLWQKDIHFLRPPPLRVYAPEVFIAIGSLKHDAVFKFVEFQGYCDALSRMIDLWASLDPSLGRHGIGALMDLLDTVGRQADSVAVIIAKHFDIRLKFETTWPPTKPSDRMASVPDITN